MQLNTEQLQTQLILEEGMRLLAYDDATGYPVPEGGTCRGKLTVGVGRNLDANPLTNEELAIVGHDARTLPITYSNAMLLLNNDIAACCRALDDSLRWWKGADEIRARVLVDLTFNMGIHKLLDFQHFLSSMRAGTYDVAADDLKHSIWYGQVGMRGKRLVAMVCTGEDYTS